jgi:hypothetical protein
MEPKVPKKHKPLSSLYGDPAPAKGKKANASGKPRSKANPSIVLIDPKDKAELPAPVKRQHPPPRCLPAHIAAGGNAVVCVASGVASSSVAFSRPSTPVVSGFFLYAYFLVYANVVNPNL